MIGGKYKILYDDGDGSDGICERDVIKRMNLYTKETKSQEQETKKKQPRLKPTLKRGDSP